MKIIESPEKMTSIQSTSGENLLIGVSGKGYHYSLNEFTVMDTPFPLKSLGSGGYGSYDKIYIGQDIKGNRYKWYGVYEYHEASKIRTYKPVIMEWPTSIVNTTSTTKTAIEPLFYHSFDYAFDNFPKKAEIQEEYVSENAAYIVDKSQNVYYMTSFNPRYNKLNIQPKQMIQDYYLEVTGQLWRYTRGSGASGYTFDIPQKCPGMDKVTLIGDDYRDLIVLKENGELWSQTDSVDKSFIQHKIGHIPQGLSTDHVQKLIGTSQAIILLDTSGNAYGYWKYASGKMDNKSEGSLIYKNVLDIYSGYLLSKDHVVSRFDGDQLMSVPALTPVAKNIIQLISLYTTYALTEDGKILLLTDSDYQVQGKTTIISKNMPFSMDSGLLQFTKIWSSEESWFPCFAKAKDGKLYVLKDSSLVNEKNILVRKPVTFMPLDIQNVAEVDYSHSMDARITKTNGDIYTWFVYQNGPFFSEYTNLEPYNPEATWQLLK